MRNTIARLLVFSFPFLAFIAGRNSSPPDDFSLSLPQDFTAETVVESLGSNRHIAVNTNGDVYVKLNALKDGKGIMVLRKVNGVYKTINSFGNYSGTGRH